MLEANNDMSDHEGSLVSCLEQIPSLVELILPTPNQSVALDEELLLRLTECSSVSNTLLPNLQILRFHHEMPRSECYKALTRLLNCRVGNVQERRRRELCKLRTVEIMGLGYDLESFKSYGGLFKTLSQHADQGFDIYASDLRGERISLRAFEYVLSF